MKFQRNKEKIDKDKIVNIFKKYINDEQLINGIIEKCIMNKILIAGVFSTELYSNSTLDFELRKEEIDVLLNSLNTGEKLFTDEVMKVLKTINSINLEVSYDYDIFDIKSNRDLIPNKDTVITLVETISFNYIFDFFKENYVELYNSPLLEELENYINSLYDTENIIYQIGGYPIISIQDEVKNLIAFYYGEYGDGGALYVYSLNNALNYCVDMS